MYIVDFHHVDFDRNPGDDEFALNIHTLQDHSKLSLSFIPEQNQWFKLFHEGHEEPATYYKVVKTCKVITSTSSIEPNHFEIFVLKYDSEAQFNDEIYSALVTLIG